MRTVDHFCLLRLEKNVRTVVKRFLLYYILIRRVRQGSRKTIFSQSCIFQGRTCRPIEPPPWRYGLRRRQ